MDVDGRRRALAELAVVGGANVQPGQVLSVGCQPGQAEMVRHIADVAYRRGARFVDVAWHDPAVKAARVRHAPEDTLDWVPPWAGDRVRTLGEMGAAMISLSGPTMPTAFDGIDPARLGRDRLPALRETMTVVTRGLVNWTVVPCPNPEWARLVYPQDTPDDAERRLWDAVAHVCRLDAPDPVAAWAARCAELSHRCDVLNRTALSAVRFSGPGTDLTVGLLPGARWLGGDERRHDGVTHQANIPTEEVFTTPDPERTHGVVTATMPLELGGTVVRGLHLRFEGGSAVSVEAEQGGEVLRGRMAVDPGARRLGEVALVDGSGRIGPLGTVFFDTLLDENASCHIALGAAYPGGADPGQRHRINTSDIHLDFMVGGPQVTVFGVDADGRESVLLRDGAWCE